MMTSQPIEIHLCFYFFSPSESRKKVFTRRKRRRRSPAEGAVGEREEDKVATRRQERG